MRRITISVEDALADAFDGLVERKGYLNRSEAFRDLLRRVYGEEDLVGPKAQWCVATVSYLFDHHERQLSNRITQLQHVHHHDVAVATQHVHLDHDNCLERVVLKDRIDAVRACADSIISQTGVRNGNVHLVPVEIKRKNISASDTCIFIRSGKGELGGSVALVIKRHSFPGSALRRPNWTDHSR